MKFGYSNGFNAGFAAAKDIYERQLAIVREELADARIALADEKVRVEGAVDQLLIRIGARAIAPSTTQHEERKLERQERLLKEMMADGDPTADRPLGTPGSEFDRENDPRADLLYGVEQ